MNAYLLTGIHIYTITIKEGRIFLFNDAIIWRWTLVNDHSAR